MRLLTYILIILSFQSCKKENTGFKENFNYLYEVLNKDFDNNIRDQINRFEFYSKQNKLDSIEIRKISLYSNLTNNYLNFLSDVKDKFEKSNVNPFYEGDNNTEIAKEYISKTNKYRTGILKIIGQQRVKESIQLNFSTKNPVIDDAKHGKIMVSYLDYYFKGISKKSFCLYLKNKEKIAIELQSDYLAELMQVN